MLIGFAIGRFARSAAVATADGTSGADGRIDCSGESDTGADDGADEAGMDATADDGNGATEGATAAFGEFDVPQPATSTAVIATPTAMRAAVLAFGAGLTGAVTVDDGDGERASMQSR